MQMLNKLQNCGYIKKVADPNDKRIIRIYMTELGKIKYSELIDVRRSIGNILFKGISDEEIGFIYSILVKMKNNLDK